MANIPDFLLHAPFWFALVNVAAVVVLPRLGIALSANDLAAINLVVATIFGVAPVAQTAQNAKANALAKKQNLVE